MSLLRIPKNRGFASANNQGILIAKGRYVLLNSDTLILDNAIEKVFSFAEEMSDVAVVGWQAWEDSDTIQKTCFQFQSPWNVFCVSTGIARLFPNSKMFGGDKMLWWNRTDQREVDVV